MKEIAIIGSGFSSLSAACYLAKAGHQVTVFEKNEKVGGRAQQFEKDGFLFDMGPTWYWMPDVFERFFADFDRSPSQYYSLERLDPAYKVYFGPDDAIQISSHLHEICLLFEKEEPGSSEQLMRFLELAEKNYEISVKDLVYRPGVSPLELITPQTIFKLQEIFFDIRRQVKRMFKNPRLTKILEFPVLFLGAKPGNTPSFYNFMNWADFGLGTWHPKGGMYEVVKGIRYLANDLDVKFELNAPIDEIKVDESGKATEIMSNGKVLPFDVVVSGADYHHTETLLAPKYRQYSEAYWKKKTFAPSALLFYVGFDKKIENVAHHTLFFDAEFDGHAEFIYDNPAWPTDPLFYASFPGKTDNVFAPEGKEAATFLIPIAPGLDDGEPQRQKYFDLIIDRLEKNTGHKVRESILFSRSYCVSDFVSDFNSYQGNAYGLANTLKQTAFLRPRIKSKKVNNLFFTGQLTVPGPGVPPALISGKIAAEMVLKHIEV